VIIVFFGGATLLLHDETFIKWKPTVLYWLAGVIFLGALAFRQNLVKVVMEEGGLALFISQSGETADTLAALRHARAEGQKIAVVVNVPTSTMARDGPTGLFESTASLRETPLDAC